MTQTIDAAVKTLTEFEAALDFAKGESSDAKKLLVKSAANWAAAARDEAVAQVQKIAEARLTTAREEAEKEAETIKATGRSSLEEFHTAITERKEKAVDLVVKRLVGAKL